MIADYRSKYWLFTWNTNVNQKKLPDFLKLKRHLNIISDYSTFQLESGKLRGKKHIQGALYLNGPRTSKKSLLESFQKHFGNIGGLTLQIAHDKEAIMKYASKSETRVSETIYCGRKEKYDDELYPT